MESKKEFILTLIKTLLATLSVAYYCEINRNVIFLIVIFILIYVFLKSNKFDKNIYTTILSIICNILLILGKYLVFLESNISLRTIVLRSILCLIGGFILFKEIFNYLFAIIAKKKIISKQTKLKPIYIFIISFVIITLVWVIVLLAEYPSSIMQDTLNQFQQIFGDAKYHNDHPFVHTIYIKALYNIASLFCKTSNNRLFFMATIQTVINAAFYSYVSYFIYKRTGNAFASLLTTLFYTFISYNPSYNVTISKDASFTLATNLLFISILLLIERRKPARIILFVISSFLFCLVRKNGLYAYIFIFFVALITFISTKKEKKLLLYLFISLLFSVFIKNTIIPIAIDKLNENIVSSTINNDKPKIVKPNYSIYIPAEIPMQQIANVVYHERELTDREIELIESRCPIDIIRKEYDKYIIDPIAKAIREHTDYESKEYSDLDYIKLWTGLFLKYPQDYIESYVYLTRYYFYPNRILDTNIYGVANNDYGFSKQPLISSSFTNSIENIMDSQKDIPVIDILYSPGTVMIIVFFMFFYYMQRKKYNVMITLSMFIGIWITIMLVTPSADSFRYIYPVVGSLPLIMCLPLIKIDSE